MNPKQKSLGDRMKEYENVTNTYLVHRMPFVARIDGRAFHSFCKGMYKPCDNFFIKVMDETAKYLRENVPDCAISYVESDEITLCIFPYKTFTTTPFFDGRIQKLCSILASMATWKFNSILNEWQNYPDCDIEDLPSDYKERIEERAWANRLKNRVAMFDCRVWNLPREEVLNCLLWRQQDSKRNAILTAGQTFLGKKQSFGFKTTEIIDKLLKEKKIDYWTEIPKNYHYGRTFTSLPEEKIWIFDNAEDRKILEQLINCEEE